jgi:D-tyrosyl-tRNA(Tyr) deacylase
MRPSFSSAASPQDSQRLFNYLVSEAMSQHQPVECGQFGADMQVALVNDGPVTFQLMVAPNSSGIGA